MKIEKSTTGNFIATMKINNGSMYYGAGGTLMEAMTDVIEVYLKDLIPF